jgi:DnaJ-class molecular chaperone
MTGMEYLLARVARIEREIYVTVPCPVCGGSGEVTVNCCRICRTPIMVPGMLTVDSDLLCGHPQWESTLFNPYAKLNIIDVEGCGDCEGQGRVLRPLSEIPITPRENL